MADLTPETLAAWREDAERERRVAGRPQHPLRILRLLDALAIGIRAHSRTMERAEKAEADLLGERAMSDHHRREAERISEYAQQVEAALSDSERRGAMAALREAADGLDASAASGLAWAPLHKDYSAWLRARADRIEGDES